MANPGSKLWRTSSTPIRLTYPLAQFPSIRVWRLGLLALSRAVPDWRSDPGLASLFARLEWIADETETETETDTIRTWSTPDQDLLSLCWPLEVAFQGSGNIEEFVEAADYCCEWMSGPGEVNRRWQCDLIRDLLGDPFQPVEFDPNWKTDTTLGLARRIYADQDFSLMPILSDALQDAGCALDIILEHGRSGLPHVRGCWLLDALLDRRPVDDDILDPRSVDDWLDSES